MLWDADLAFWHTLFFGWPVMKKFYCDTHYLCTKPVIWPYLSKRAVFPYDVLPKSDQQRQCQWKEERLGRWQTQLLRSSHCVLFFRCNENAEESVLPLPSLQKRTSKILWGKTVEKRRTTGEFQMLLAWKRSVFVTFSSHLHISKTAVSRCEVEFFAE